jgi:2-polyprenyl-3-methyl-5-hydroxy-6-metoxy-1,4-benzoquinol methylase
MKVAERFSLDARMPSWIRFQHLARYEWCRELVAGKSVVDAACGTGFGSRILAEAGASSVQAFDLSAEAVADATQRCAGLDQVHVQVGDVTKLPITSSSVDIYVCFETIEHVPQDQEVVAEAARILSPGGRYLCSSPNRTLTNPGTKLSDPPFNPHHVREYNQQEFAALFAPHFSRIKILGQSMFPRYWQHSLTAVSRINRMAAVRMHQVRKLTGSLRDRLQWHWPTEIPANKEPEFLVAVAEK